jgi:hypothetical protein
VRKPLQSAKKAGRNVDRKLKLTKKLKNQYYYQRRRATRVLRCRELDLPKIVPLPSLKVEFLRAGWEMNGEKVRIQPMEVAERFAHTNV